MFRFRNLCAGLLIASLVTNALADNGQLCLGELKAFSRVNNADVALQPFFREDGKLKGTALHGKTYPMVLQNITTNEVSEHGMLDVVVSAGHWVVHPAIVESAVLKLSLLQAGTYDIELTATDLKLGPIDFATAGVGVKLFVNGKLYRQGVASLEQQRAKIVFSISACSLKKDDEIAVEVTSRGLHICDGTDVALKVTPSTAREINVSGDWSRLPPIDVDRKLADLIDPIPRAWRGQKSALRFARVFEKDSKIWIDWQAALPLLNEPKLAGSPISLWRGHHEKEYAVSLPRFFAVTKSLRIFRDELPDTEVLLPFVVVVDGNSEDGNGGYVIGLDGAQTCSIEKGDGICTLSSTDKNAKPWVLRFNGNWLAGLQTVARHKPSWFNPPVNVTADLWITIIAEWMQDDNKWNASFDGWQDWLTTHLKKRQALLSDKRLAETLKHGILFNTRRSTTWNHCVAQYFGWRQRAGGSLYVLEEPGKSLKVRDIIQGRMPSGSYLEPRLSPNADKVMFAFVQTEGPLNPYSMKVNEEGGDDHYYHLWQVNVDGSDLKQITRGVYEDFMPVWLCDGDIAFMSSRRASQSRCFWFGYSNRWQAYTLFRMHADGSDIQQLSWNDVAEWFPTLSNNGEILFARWDYIFRNAVLHQNLWTVRPDGTNPRALWGNETHKPHCTFQIHAIPNSRKIAAIASAHHAVTGGPLILIDPAVDENSEEAITHITPGHYPENDMPHPDETDPKAHNDWYNSPWPYGEDLFLICWSRNPLQYEPSRPIPDESLGIYILSASGQRELLWRDGFINASAPQPLVVQKMPPKLESQLDANLQKQKLGEVFIADVYRGLKKVTAGNLASIRVVQVFPRTTPDQYLPNTGRGGHENALAVLGEAKIETDGSSRFIVPAEKALYFQVLDKQGRVWRTMRSSTSLMPGERVSCVGCHERKREASSVSSALSLAMKNPAQKLLMPPEAGRPWGFVENVQPIFDRKCAKCHNDEKPPKGIALTRTIDARFSRAPQVKEVGEYQYSAPFTRSYSTLCWTDEKTGSNAKDKQFLWYKLRRGKSIDGKDVEMVPCWPEYNTVETTPEGPSQNALGSGLLGHLSRGKHAQILTPEELRMIITWLDLNAMFYGCYEDPDLTRQLEGKPIAMPKRQ